MVFVAGATLSLVMPRKALSPHGSSGKSAGAPKLIRRAGDRPASGAKSLKPVEETTATVASDDLSRDPMTNRGLPFPVVGVGASAGGFEAVMNLLKHLPVNTGMAFVVVLHLDPRHKSKLSELVARATTMPVREIKNDMPVEPNAVYVLPANLDVIIERKRLKLVRRPDSE